MSLESDEVEAPYRDHPSRVEAIAVSPDGQWLASVGKDRRLAVRDLRSGQLHLLWEEAQGTLSSVAFSSDSTAMAIGEAGGETKWLRLFDVASKAQIHKVGAG